MCCRLSQSATLLSPPDTQPRAAFRQGSAGEAEQSSQLRQSSEIVRALRPTVWRRWVEAVCPVGCANYPRCSERRSADQAHNTTTYTFQRCVAFFCSFRFFHTRFVKQIGLVTNQFQRFQFIIHMFSLRPLRARQNPC